MRNAYKKVDTRYNNQRPYVSNVLYGTNSFQTGPYLCDVTFRLSRQEIFSCGYLNEITIKN